MESSNPFEDLLTICFSSLLSEVSATDWKSHTKNKSYELFTKSGGESFKMVKVIGQFNANPIKVKDFILDPSSITKYDDSKESRTELESGVNYKIFLTKGAKVFMMDPRDTVILMGFRIEANGTVLIAGCSVGNEKAPEVKGRIRAHCEIMGYVLEPVEGDENKCKFVYLGKMDPKGSVPAMIANKMVAKQGETMMKLGVEVEKI